MAWLAVSTNGLSSGSSFSALGSSAFGALCSSAGAVSCAFSGAASSAAGRKDARIFSSMAFTAASVFCSVFSPPAISSGVRSGARSMSASCACASSRVFCKNSAVAALAAFNRRCSSSTSLCSAPILARASSSAPASTAFFFSSASSTMVLAMRWAVRRAARMESSVARYSSTLSTSTLSLALRAAFSL